MCGLAGIVSSKGQPDLADLERASARLRHRGPDGCGMMADARCGLVHRRLSILDVSQAGHQPMRAAPLPLWIAYNGEVYNYRSLRDELSTRGWKFKSDCDTEVVLKAYAQWGPAAVSRLRGMFAMAIWDARERSLFLARDRFGIKPLYYTHLSDGALAFASEIKALRAFPAVSSELNHAGLAHYLRYHYVPEPHSIYRDIHRLPAGACLLWKDGAVTIKQAGAECSLIDDSSAPSEDEVVAVLSDSVSAHLISDVPVGVFLSGGVDSSLIAALMRRGSGERLHSFSIGFRDGLKSADETEFARTVANHLALEHHELTIGEGLLGRLPETLGFFDEPFANPAALIAARLSEFAARYVKVVLSGVGGDEFFGGYPRYVAMSANRALNLIPRRLCGLAARAAYRLPSSTDRKWMPDRLARLLRAGADSPACVYDNLVAYSTPEEAAAVVNSDLIGNQQWRDEARLFDARIVSSPEHAMEVDVASYLPGDLLTYTDRCAMAYSLEVRTPLVDVEVARIARRMLLRDKIRGFETKSMLKRIAARLVPPEVIYRKKKGFAVPIAEWLRRDSWFVDEMLAAANLRDLPELDPKGVRAVKQRHAGGDNSAAYLLWALASYVTWRTNVHTQGST